MKRFLSFLTVCTLFVSLSMAQAQDKPKEASKDKASSGCVHKASVKSDQCGDKAHQASMKKDGCCAGHMKHAEMKSTSTSPKGVKQASNHECGPKCTDDCEMAHAHSMKKNATKKD